MIDNRQTPAPSVTKPRTWKWEERARAYADENGHVDWRDICMDPDESVEFFHAVNTAFERTPKRRELISGYRKIQFRLLFRAAKKRLLNVLSDLFKKLQ